MLLKLRHQINFSVNVLIISFVNFRMIAKAVRHSCNVKGYHCSSNYHLRVQQTTMCMFVPECNFIQQIQYNRRIYIPVIFKKFSVQALFHI